MRREKRGMTYSLEHKLPQIMTAFMAVVCALILLAPSAFADDADGSDDIVVQAAGTEPSVTVSIVCSEHGSVNDKTGEFTETVSSGSDLHLSFTADTGYLIGKLLINDEPLAAADLEGIAGEQNGQLDLEGLEEDLSLQVIFMTPEEYADQEISPGEADDPPAGGGSDDPGTDTPADDPGITAPAGQDGDGDTTVDPLPSDDNTGTDEEGDTGADDGDKGFDPDDNWGTEDDDPASQDDEYQGTYDDSTATDLQESGDVAESTDGSDSISTEDTVDTNSTDEADDTSETDVEKSVGTAAFTTVNDNDSDKDAESDEKGDYKGDYSTPKTGDESLAPAEALLMMGLGFLCLSCIIAIRSDEKAEGGDEE